MAIGEPASAENRFNILSSPGAVERCQHQLLGPEELAIVRKQEAEGL
jgi:hypothetical protein